MSPSDSSATKLRVGVAGASGYVGGELLRLLAGHPDVGEIQAYSASHAGKPWSSAHRHLVNAPDGLFVEPDLHSAARSCDVVFFALSHGLSQQTMPEMIDADALLIDLSADYRVSDHGLYTQSYGSHASHELTRHFCYALADTLGHELRAKTRLAAPGCFATAALLATYPLARHGVLDGPPVYFAITGSSGSGASPSQSTHHPVRANNVFAYKLDGHRHQAEIADQLARWTDSSDADSGMADSGMADSGMADSSTADSSTGDLPALITHSGPFVRGIYLTLVHRTKEPVVRPLDLLRSTYEGRPFVRVLDAPPELSAVVGTNFAHLHAASRNDGREIVVTVAIDNLVKGAAGQAIQAMNLSLRLEETAGLTFSGLYTC